MSTAPIRHGTASQTAATQRADHDPRQHGQHNAAGAGRGQHNGYVFRLGPRPAPPSARRAGPLRPRQPPRAAQGAAGGQEPEHESLDPTSTRTDAVEDKEHRTQAVNMDSMSDAGSDNEAGHRESHAPLQARMRPETTPTAQALEALLEQLCGAPAQALCKNTGSNAMAEHAQALISVLLAIARPDQASSAVKLSSDALQLMAVRAYLHHSGEPRAFSTLERVKQLLVERSSTAARQGARPAPASEKEQDRHLLLPLVLLNADRPRTRDQRDQACDRMELLSASRHMQREPR